MNTTIKITRRSRTVGFSWTNSVEQTRGGLSVKDPGKPQVVGTAKQCLAEFENACRINSGGVSWAGAWFVGGKRVVSVDGGVTGSRDIARQLRLMYEDYGDGAVAYVSAAIEE